MSAPAATDRAWARMMVRKHLAQMREDKLDAEEGWEIDESDLDEGHCIYITMRARKADGTPLDDIYVNRLEFSHYPTYPPTIEFVNPDTLAYDPAKDQAHVPVLAKSPPDQSIALSPAYDARGQLLCHSLNYEYYIRGGHHPGPEIHWKEGTHTLVTTLMFHQKILRQPYYGGRRPQ